VTAPTLYDIAGALMDITKQALTENGLPIPNRQVIYVGSIPADCEQLAVVFDSWNPAPAQEGMVVCQTYRWGAAFTILITRKCAPVLTSGKTIPSAADMGGAAKVASDDAEALLDVVANVGEHDGSVSVTLGPPSGGLQSSILEITVPVTRGALWPM
jgi:hypothetical protein